MYNNHHEKVTLVIKKSGVLIIFEKIYYILQYKKKLQAQ